MKKNIKTTEREELKNLGTEIEKFQENQIIENENNKLERVPDGSDEEKQVVIKDKDHVKAKSINYVNLIFICSNVGLGFFYFGYNLGVFNSMQQFMTVYLDWREDKTLYISLVSSFIFVGALIGSFVSGKVASKIGRKNSLIVVDIIGIIGNSLTLVANTGVIVFGRFIIGLSIGSFSTISPIYINEYVPYEVTGACGMIYNFLFCISVLISFFMGNGLPINPKDDLENQWWRFMFIFPVIFLTINLFTLFFIFKLDTPKYLYVKKNKPDLAKKALELIYKNEEDIINHLKEFDYLLTNEGNKIKMTYRDLFRGKYIKRTIIAIIIIITKQLTMIECLTNYSNLIYLRYEDKETSTLYTILFQTMECLGALIAFFLVQKFGRKSLMITGFGFTGVSVFLMAFLYIFSITSAQKYIIIFYFFVAGFTIDPIIWVFNTDILPDKGCGLVASIGWFVSLTLVITFPYMIESELGLAGTFFIFSVLTLLSTIFMIIFVKETKNKTEIQIDHIYSTWFKNK